MTHLPNQSVERIAAGGQFSGLQTPWAAAIFCRSAKTSDPLRQMMNPRIPTLALFVSAITLIPGCANAPLPRARGYDVRLSGDRTYWANTVKFHGCWIEVDTDKGQVWAPRGSVVS